MNHNEVMKNQIWNLLDKIEDKVKKMAHEIPEIKDALHKWQDGKMNRASFYNLLTKYWDNL